MPSRCGSRPERRHPCPAGGCGWAATSGGPTMLRASRRRAWRPSVRRRSRAPSSWPGHRAPPSSGGSSGSPARSLTCAGSASAGERSSGPAIRAWSSWGCRAPGSPPARSSRDAAPRSSGSCGGVPRRGGPAVRDPATPVADALWCRRGAQGPMARLWVEWRPRRRGSATGVAGSSGDPRDERGGAWAAIARRGPLDIDLDRWPGSNEPVGSAACRSARDRRLHLDDRTATGRIVLRDEPPSSG